MGEVFAECKLINREKGLERKVKFLVTGATIPVVPADILKELKVRVVDRDSFELASGKSKVFKIGEVSIKLNGKKHIFPVAFGPEKSQPLLGVVVLETFGYKIDPVSGKLVKRKLLMY